VRDRPDAQDATRFVTAYVVLTATWFAIGEGVTASDSLVRSDERVARWFVDRRTPTLNDWATIGSGLAETITKIGLTLVAVVVLRMVFHRWRESMVLALPLVLEASVFITVTFLVKRPRPPVPRLQDSPVDSSFPSGHVAAAVVYGAVVIVVWMHSHRWWPRVLAAVVTLLVAAAVAWARLYMGMHHLTDVLAGALLGLASVLASWWIISAHLERHEGAPLRAASTDRSDGWVSA
jgi:membrane-associated phospholipid phosphatase